METAVLYKWRLGDPELKLTVSGETMASLMQDRNPEIDREEFLELSKDYMRYRTNGPLTVIPGVPRRHNVVRKSAIALSLGNCRFLLALLERLCEGQPFLVSFDLLTQVDVVSALHQCITRRQTQQARQYQLFLEMRTILAFLLEKMRLEAEPEQRHKFVPDILPSFIQVHNLVMEASKGRRLQDKQNLVQSQEVLESKGRWLSNEDTAVLVESLEEYLSSMLDRFEDEKVAATEVEAFSFQNHLVLYLFAGNVIPVPRVQCFLKLKIDKELKYDVVKNRYCIEILDLSESKVALPAILNIPAELTPLMTKWLRFFRPRLVARTELEHDFVWVKRDGSGPRASLNSVFKATMSLYIRGRACPQSFRHPTSFRGSFLIMFLGWPRQLSSIFGPCVSRASNLGNVMPVTSTLNVLCARELKARPYQLCATLLL